MCNVSNQNPVMQVPEVVQVAQAGQMVNLVEIENSQVVTTSVKIAEIFGKQHKHVLRDIRNLECSEDFRQSNFGLIQKISDLGQGRTRKDPMYYITRDGFMFLVMGFTGKTAAKWKEAYIKAFNDMEAKIRAKQMQRAIEEHDRKESEEYDRLLKREQREEAEVDRRVDELARERAEQAKAEEQTTGQLTPTEGQRPIVENYNGKRVITSRTLVGLTGRRHCSVMDSIHRMMKYADRPGRMFIKSEKWAENPHCHNWYKFYYVTESGFKLLCKRTHVSPDAVVKVAAAFNASKRKAVGELVKTDKPKAPTTPPTPTAKAAAKQPQQPTAPAAASMPQTPADLMQRFVKAMGVMMGVDTKEMFNLMDKGE